MEYKNNKEDKKGSSVSLEEQAIINLIRNNPNINQEEIAKKVNKSLRTIKTRMKEMQEKGLIIRENSKRNSLWKICKYK